jgi:hypothetical protein
MTYPVQTLSPSTKGSMKQQHPDRTTRHREGLTTFLLILVAALVTIAIANLTDLQTLPRILITLVAVAVAYPVIRRVLKPRA